MPTPLINLKNVKDKMTVAYNQLIGEQTTAATSNVSLNNLRIIIFRVTVKKIKNGHISYFLLIGCKFYQFWTLPKFIKQLGKE